MIAVKTYTMKELADRFQELAPLAYACSWDNPGLITGSYDKEIKRIAIALDATEDVIDEAISAEADLLLTHHPLVFKAVSKINDGNSLGRRLMKLIKADICCYAMHTNFDAAPGCMADIVADIMGVEKKEPLEPVEGFENESFGIGFVGELPEPMYPNVLADHIKKKFNLPFVLYYAGDGSTCDDHGKRLPFLRKVKRVAVCPGSGRGMVSEAIKKGAEAFITGDMGHHDGIDAVDEGIALIDAGHYGLERVFTGFMADYIRKNELGETVLIRGADFPAQAVLDKAYSEGGFLKYREDSLKEQREPLF